MTGRPTLALVVALALVATALAPPAAVAAAQDGGPCADAGVGGTDRVVVGELAGTDEVVNGTVSLYPETTLRLFVCGDGDEKTFDFRDADAGLEAVGERADRFQVTVRVTAERAGGTLAVGGAWLANANDPDPLRVHVPADASVASSVTDVGPLSFADPAAAREYNATEAAFARNLSAADRGVADVRAASDALNRSALDPTALEEMVTLTANGDVNLTAPGNKTLVASARALENASAVREGSLDGTLHRAAWRTATDGRHLEQADALAAAEDERRAELRRALGGFEAALEARAGEAAGSARGDLVVGLVGGLVVGLLVALGYFRWKAGGESYDRQFTRDAGLDRGDLLVVVVPALAVLLATLVAVHLWVGLPDLFGVIL